MRCILRILVVLAIASPAWAGAQDPTVSTPVPNIHAPGAPAVTTPSAPGAFQTTPPSPPAVPGTTTIVTDPASAPTATYSGTQAGTQSATTTTAVAPSTYGTSGTYYYYSYPVRPRFGFFRWVMPSYYTYTAANTSPTYGMATY